MGHMRSITDVKCTAPPLIKTQLPTISSQQTHQNIYDETKSRAVVQSCSPAVLQSLDKNK